MPCMLCSVPDMKHIKESSVPALERVREHAAQVFDALVKGGMAVTHLDVAYAIMARSEASVRRMYAAKGRAFTRPTGIVGNLEAHDALHVLDTRAKDIVRAVTVTHNLPLSVIAPFRADHPFLKNLDPFVLANANKDGTLNLLLNAGVLRTAIADISWRESTPLVGTSANVSLKGSKFRVQDIEREILDAADIVVDYGLCKYHNAEGRSSTMIDFRDYSVVRKSVCFEAIARVMREGFDVSLPVA